MRSEFSEFTPIEGPYIDPLVDLVTVTHRPRCRYYTSMRTADDWFREYGESHRHGANKLLHWICVPAIVLSALGLIWMLPVPRAWRDVSPWLNWASIAMLAALLNYSLISLRLALGMIPVLAALAWAVLWL